MFPMFEQSQICKEVASAKKGYNTPKAFTYK